MGFRHKRTTPSEGASVHVLGRGLRAQRGVHLTLRTLREAVGKTQVEIAEGSQIDQADISRLERRESLEDCQVSTLARYVAALGGHLELVASFGDKRIALVGVVTKTTPTESEAKKRPAPAKR